MFDASKVKCVAFDCFGTVFDMEGMPREEIKLYAEHVRKADFTEFIFSDAWFKLKDHWDSFQGMERIQATGRKCIAMSNGTPSLIMRLTDKCCHAFDWDRIIDLRSARVYKPNIEAYREIEKQTGFKPEECLMVTANPTFGDIEGAAAIGMQSVVIRHGYPNTITELASMFK